MNVVTASSSPTSLSRLTLFAAGDFACNLYWQSVTLFLLFFYTDVLLLPAATAGLVAMLGALWDGIADMTVGMVAQRARSYRRFVIGGSLPLGIAFVALFALSEWRGTGLALAALAAQMVFRTLYALVNVPYAAWSTRISDDSGDRAVVAGLRMLFGTAAATLVALTMPRLGYAPAAAIYAVVAVPLLVLVAARSREVSPLPTAQRIRIGTYLATLVRNRAFVTLNLAMAMAGIAAAVVNQSVLHYFDHVVRRSASGPGSLALMGIVGAACVPLWMVLTRRFGARAIWLTATAIGLSAVAIYTASAGGTVPTQVLLVTLQIAFTALNLGFWAMLPDTVDYGEATAGIRAEAVAFGVAALVQKIALAIAAGVIGLAYHRIGYIPGPRQPAETVAGIRLTMLVGAAVGMSGSALAMLANPLRRGVHGRVLASLRQRSVQTIP